MSDSQVNIDSDFSHALATAMAQDHLSTLDVAEDADVSLQEVRAALAPDHGEVVDGEVLARLETWLDVRNGPHPTRTDS